MPPLAPSKSTKQPQIRWQEPNQPGRKKEKSFPQSTWNKYRGCIEEQWKKGSTFESIANWVNEQNLPQFKPK
jgi:hypothetical protein